MPTRVSAKSYLTGSRGEILLKPSVASRAALRSAVHLFVKPSVFDMRYICVSSGTMSIAGETSPPPPGSFASERTIHRRKSFSRLHALPYSGV